MLDENFVEFDEEDISFLGMIGEVLAKIVISIFQVQIEGVTDEYNETKDKYLSEYFENKKFILSEYREWKKKINLITKFSMEEYRKWQKKIRRMQIIAIYSFLFTFFLMALNYVYIKDHIDARTVKIELELAKIRNQIEFGC